MPYLFTSESVSEGHPDKVADQISDALLDEFLRRDPQAKVACETMVTTGLVVCSGEVQTDAWVDIQHTVRDTIRQIGYTKADYRFDSESCGIISTIHEQSPDIRQGVVRETAEEQGAGDQGMMFGYASTELDNLMPLPIELAHRLVQDLAAIRKEGQVMKYLRPDSKSQVTVLYDDNHQPVEVTTIVVSTQHDEANPAAYSDHPTQKQADERLQEQIRQDIITYLIPRVISNLPDDKKDLLKNYKSLLVNPTGKFVIGGPHGDTGLTGRKIIVDTYGGSCPHGGGAFSGKDPSKVDRSAAYAARHMAKNMVAAGLAEKVLVQVAYAIGVAEPVSLFINTFGTAKAREADGSLMSDGRIADIMGSVMDMRPFSIIQRLGLQNPIYQETARYGHFGRDPREVEVEVFYQNGDTYSRVENGKTIHFKKVCLFSWEKTEYTDSIRSAFGLE
ncbi:MAG TPA: methionine adenosyltransferase [Bacteroidales bacterium]|nr:methionine adenosyltransferase [Bacteroidales bacterium]